MALKNLKMMRLIGLLMDDKMSYFISISKSIVAISSLFLLVNCTPTSDDPVDANLTHTASSIGWLHGNCIAIINSDDLKGRKIIIVNPDDKQEYFESTIIKKATSGEECYALLDDRASINAQNGRQFYTVSSSKPVELGIGILVDKGKSLNESDFNNVLKIYTYSYCSTSEGVQFSVWNGEAYKGGLIWSDYYYLGYDTEDNCPK